MKCRDEKIAALLPDYHSGHLEAGKRAQVDAHVAGCEICRISLRTMGLLSQEHVEDMPDKGADHPSADLLAKYQHDPQALDTGIRDSLERHIETCRECEFDVEWLADLERDFSAPTPAGRRHRAEVGFGSWFPGWLRRPRPAYALTTVALIIGVTWLYRSYQVESTPAGKTYTLREMMRSSFAPMAVVRAAGDQRVRLTISQPPRLSDREHRFRLTDSREMQEYPVAIAADFGNPELIRLDLPVSNLSDGLYILIWTDVSKLSSADSISKRFPFELKTQN